MAPTSSNLPLSVLAQFLVHPESGQILVRVVSECLVKYLSRTWTTAL